MIDILIASEGDMTIDADKCGGPASSKNVFLDLFLFEGDIAVYADKGNHC